MNVAFWILTIIVLVLVWLCLSFAYKGVGSVMLKLINDARDEIIGDDEEENQDETKENEKE